MKSGYLRQAAVSTPFHRADGCARIRCLSGPQCLNALLPKCLFGVGHESA
jgi:hypothetical protein